MNKWYNKDYSKANDLGSYALEDFHRVECDVKNKISLGELCKNFEGKEWEAEKYNVATHNCQKFAAEIIKILKAIRKHERDKVRSNEKEKLPNCIISALWDNEDLSAVNTIGRIPIVGFFYDIYAADHYDK